MDRTVHLPPEPVLPWLPQLCTRIHGLAVLSVLRRRLGNCLLFLVLFGKFRILNRSQRLQRRWKVGFYKNSYCSNNCLTAKLQNFVKVGSANSEKSRTVVHHFRLGLLSADLYGAELSLSWVDPWVGLGWVGLGRDFSVFGGLAWVGSTVAKVLN